MKKELQALAARNRAAKTQKERDKVALEMEKLKNKDPKAFTEALENLIKTTASRVEELTIADRMGEMTKMLSMAYIARNYFGKSRSWLYHKFSGTNNGAADDFSDVDRERLKSSLQDIAERIRQAADRI